MARSGEAYSKPTLLAPMLIAPDRTDPLTRKSRISCEYGAGDAGAGALPRLLTTGVDGAMAPKAVLSARTVNAIVEMEYRNPRIVTARTFPI